MTYYEHDGTIKIIDSQVRYKNPHCILGGTSTMAYEERLRPKGIPYYRKINAP